MGSSLAAAVAARRRRDVAKETAFAFDISRAEEASTASAAYRRSASRAASRVTNRALSNSSSLLSILASIAALRAASSAPAVASKRTSIAI